MRPIAHGTWVVNTWIMRKVDNYLSPTHQDHAPTEKYGTKLSSGRRKLIQSSSSSAKSFVYIKDATEENMKCLLQIFPPCLPSWKYFLRSVVVFTSKATRFAGRISVTLWKEAHISLPTREHHLTYWYFLKEKRNFFCCFYGEKMFSPPTLQSPLHSCAKDPRRSWIMFVSSSHTNVIYWVLCLDTEFTPF